MDAEERIEQGRAIGQAEVDEDDVECVAVQAVDGVRQLSHLHDARSPPIAPLAVFLDLYKSFLQQICIFQIVFDQQNFEDSWAVSYTHLDVYKRQVE